MKRKLFMFLSCLFIGICCYAQQITISGKVFDADGIELPGANVSVKGTQTGALTDTNGMFKIENVQGGENAILVFSYIGYESQEIKIGKQKVFNIKLQESNQQLEEVVVVAYGTQKKKDLTGAITTVDGKTISVQKTSTVSRALEGTVPGLQVSSVDGQPGWDTGIRVRGLGTAQSNGNGSGALIVIDGVPSQTDNPLSTLNSEDIQSVTVLKDAASTALYGARGSNGVILVTTKKGTQGKTKISFHSNWGVNEVGPFHVNKITNASDYYEYMWLSIYNSVRYGVKNGLPSGNTTNLQNPNMSDEEARQFASAHLFDYVGSNSSFQRNRLNNYMLYNVPGASYSPTGSGTSQSATMSGAYLVNTDGKINPNAEQLYSGGEYDSELLKKTFRQEYNISASGGSDKVDYFMSLGYLSDPSYIKSSSFDRYTARTNVNAKPFTWLRAGANVSYTYTITNQMSTTYGRNPGSNAANIFRYIDGMSPLVPLYARDASGNYIYEDNDVNKSETSYYWEGKKVDINPSDTYSPLGPTAMQGYQGQNILGIMDLDRFQNRLDQWKARSYVDVIFLKDFTFTINASIDKYDNMRERYYNGSFGRAAGVGGMDEYSTRINQFQTTQMLNYNHDFGRHHFDAMAGHEYNNYSSHNVTWGSGYEYIPGLISPGNFVGRYSNGKGLSSPGYSSVIRRMESYIGRGQYIYDNKYFLTGSIRRDGSSKFRYAKDRWGTFWSVGGGWRLTQESFMEPTQDWLQNAKIRASYGVIGNQNAIGDYSGYTTWSRGAIYRQTTNGTGTPDTYTMGVGGFVNDALTWENTNTFDCGIDVSIFNRINATIDYYNRLTTNTVWNQPVSVLATGQQSLQKNNAKLRNAGIEVELGIDIIKKKDLYWNVSLNGTHYTTTLAKLPEGSVVTEDGTYEANFDAWNVAGTSAGSYVSYLRGEGKDYYQMYMYKYVGVDQSTGLPLYMHRVTKAEEDANTYPGYKKGDSFETTDYNTASRYECGSAIPAWIGGLNTSVQYKNFDLTAVLSYQLGGKFFSTAYANGLYLGSAAGNALSDELVGNTWTPDNTGAKFPMQYYGTSTSYIDGATIGSWKYTDMALFNASYLKMKNITLGYTLPQQLTKKAYISKLRVYAAVDNLFMLTAASGVDPSMSLTGGMEVGAYCFPYMRTWSLGLNIEF